MQLEKACRQRIKSHAFAGNIRELQNIIEHLSIVTEGLAKEKDVVQALQHVMGLGEYAALPEKTSELIDGESLSMAVKRFESKLVQRAIERAGSKRKAAELLGVDIATVVRKSRNQS